MIKIFSMFSGYGGAEFALKQANIDFECVGYSEIEPSAIKIYDMNHPNIKNYGDCTKIIAEELPDFDLLTGGFPCQDVSISGKRDLGKGRTNLYNEILRIAKVKQPKFMVLENVKGLLSMTDKGRGLIDKIVADLKSIGYGVTWKCLNSKHYGIPQSRERVWIICKLGGWNFNEFKWPEPIPLTIFVKDILEKEVDKKYYLNEKQIKYITDALRIKKGYTQINGDIAKCQKARQFANWEGDYVFDTRKYEGEDTKRIYEGISPTICARKRTDETPAIFALRSYPRTGKDDKDRTQNPEIREDGCSNSLTSVEKDNLIVIGNIYPSGGQAGNVYDSNGLSPSLTPAKRGGKDAMPIIMNCLTTEQAHGTKGNMGKSFLKSAEKVSETLILDLYNKKAKNDGVCITLTEPHHNNLRLLNQGIFRRLTPKECFRLMGFLKDEIKIDGIKDTNLYARAGNGWEINLVSLLFNQLFKGEIKC